MLNILKYICIIPLLIYIEKNNKTSPIHPITSELFLFYITWLVSKNNYNTFFKFSFIIASLLHFIRIILHKNKYLKLPVYYNILGIVGIISIYTDNFFFIDAFIKIFVIYKVTNNFGFNLLIDTAITLALIYIIFISELPIQDKIVKNYLSSDLIYHILEIIMNFY